MSAIFSDDGRKLLGQSLHRTSSIEGTLSRITPLAEKFGITRVANVTGLDKIGIPVALAVRPNSKSVAVSQGKGSTFQHAKASAMMEAIEIWHAENVSRPVYYGKKRELEKTWRIVDTDRLPMQPDANFADTTPMLWVEGADLFSGDAVLLPFEMIHADYTRPVPPAHGYFPASTNGLASGNSDLEAVCHALAEVIERDALSLWHFTAEHDKQARRVDPATVRNEECAALLELIRKAGLDCGIWDITTDVSVPTILCIIHDASQRSGHIGLGSGTHATSAVALRRSITEAAQTRLNYISGSRDDLFQSEYDVDGLSQKRRFAEEAFGGAEGPVSFSDVGSHTHETLKEDLELMLKSLAAVGISEAVWVNLGKEEHGIPVARVVVPGLEAPHDDNDYVAGPRAREVGNLG